MVRGQDRVSPRKEQNRKRRKLCVMTVTLFPGMKHHNSIRSIWDPGYLGHVKTSKSQPRKWMRIGNMIGTANNHLPFPGSATAVSAQAVPVRRRIGREAGLALEKLAHAIEYLTDEFNNDASPQFRGSR